MRKGATALIILVGSLSAPAASAQTRVLPTGKAKDVIVKPAGNEVVVSFHRKAARAFKVIAGRKGVLGCTKIGATRRDGTSVDESESLTFRAPKRRRPFRLSLAARKYDYCEVVRPRFSRRRGNLRTTFSARTVAVVPLTQTGAVFVDERDKTGLLFGLLELASDVAKDRPDGAAQEVQRRTRGLAVPLATSESTPPAGRLGVFIDRTRVTVVVVSAAGRRLFVETAGDRFSTNVIEYLTDD